MDKNLRKWVMAGLLTALIFVSTSFIKIPSPNGYIHPGDAFVLLSGILLGPVFGAISSAVGSMLADINAGYAIYAPATFVIKGLVAFLASQANRKSRPSMILWFSLAELAMLVGYFFYDGFLGKNLLAGVASIPTNLIQAVFGMAAAFFLYLAIEKRISWDSDKSGPGAL